LALWELIANSRVTLSRRRAPLVIRVERNRGLGRAFEKALASSGNGISCQRHFFSEASQFTTTLIGSAACSRSGEFAKNRLPSADTSNGSHADPIRLR
jgi:hypothetical protein